jgi:tetratricopeptide (TPR) repeat protein
MVFRRVQTKLVVTVLGCLSVITIPAFSQEKASDKPKREPSTPEERAKAVEIARRLETDPLGKDAKDLRSAMIGWLADVPDLKVVVCDLIPELLQAKKDKNYSSELFVQSMISAGGFVAEEPSLSGDFLLVNTAAVEGTLNAYQSILKTHADAKWPVLDDLLKKRATGELPDFARDASLRCKQELLSDNPEPDKKVARANEHLHLGNKFFDRGQYQLALIEYRRLVNPMPDQSSGYHELSQTFYELKNFDKAIEYANRALELNPKCWLCFQARGSIYDDTGKSEEALADYQKAIALAPNSGHPLYNHAVTLQRLKRIPEAVADLQKAIQLEPGYVSPYKLLGALLSKQGELYAAEIQYKEFLKKEPTGDRADAVSKLLKPGVHVDGQKLKADDASFDAYAKYGLKRVDWIVDLYPKKNPAATSYTFTVEEELDALGSEVSRWEEIRKAKPGAQDKELDRLSKIAEAGFLEPFVYSYWGARSAADADSWNVAHRDICDKFRKWASEQSVLVAPIQQPTHVEWLGATL